MNLIKKFKLYTRRSLIVGMLFVVGCGLFGANSPTEKDIAISVLNGVNVAITEVVDAIHDNQDKFTDEQLVKLDKCLDRLGNLEDALKKAQEFAEAGDTPNFKTYVKFIAEELEIVVKELRSLDVKIPSTVDKALKVAILYAST